MAKIIIGLVGPMASGKSSVKKYLEEKYNAKNCRYSTPLRDVLERIGVAINRENMSFLSTSLRKTFGDDLLAKIIARDAADFKSDVVVVEGIRRMADITHLRRLPNFVLVSIDAKPETRYKRLVRRKENTDDATKTYANFLKDHELETEKTIPQVMEKASIKLDNNGTMPELCDQIEKLVKKYSKM